MARGINTDIRLTGSEEVRRQLSQIGSAGEKAMRDLHNASGTASQGLLAVSNVSRDLQTVFGRLGGLSSLGGIGTSISAIATAAKGMNTALGVTVGVVAAATGGLLALAVSGAKAASDIKEGAIRVGVAAEDYQKMNFVFSQSGSSAEGFEKAMTIILDASAKAAEAADKAAAEVVKADDAIKKSAADAEVELSKIYRARADAARVMQQSISNSLKEIDQDETKALRDLEEGRKDAAGNFVHKQLTEEQKIRRQFAERREEAEKAHQEKLAEQKKKDAAEDRELQIKRQRESESLLKAYNKTVEDAANALQDPISKITRLQKGDGTARDPVEVYKDIAQAVSEIEDPAGRSAKAIEIFGRRAGGQLVENLSEGRAGIEKLAAEAERLGIILRNPELDVGKKFMDTISKLGDVAKATLAKVGLQFSGMFSSVGDAIAIFLADAQGPIVAFAKSIAITIEPIFADIFNAILGRTDEIKSQFIRVLIPTVKLFGQALLAVGVVIGAAFTILGAAFGEIAGLINDVFGFKVTAGDIPAFGAAIYLGAIAVSALATAFTALTLAASPWLLLIGGIALALGALFLPIDTLNRGLAAVFGPETTASIVSFVEFVRTAGKQLYDTFLGTVQGLVDIWNNGLKALQDGWNIAWTAITDFVSKKITEIVSFFQPLLSVLATIRDAAVAAFNAVTSVNSAAAAPQGAARGGYIRGPGTSVSDSILARLSDGEFVIRAAAVQHFGVGFFDKLNRLRTPTFSLGGFVDGLSRPLVSTPRFAMGGLVATGVGAGGGVPVHLHIDGQSFGPMMTDAKIAEAVVRYARGQQILSGGRKPASHF